MAEQYEAFGISAIVLEIFTFFLRIFLKRTKFGDFCMKIITFWNKFQTIFAFLNLICKF